MEHAHADPQTDLREYLLILRRRKWSIGLVAGLVLLSALFFSYRQTAVYTSEARVVLLPTGTSPVVQPDLDTERGVADSAVVGTIVMQDLRLSGSVQPLLRALTVSVETNTNILDIHYTDPSPATAQRLAQGFADAYLQYKRRQAIDQVQAQATAIQQQIDSATTRLASIEHQLANAKGPARQSSLTAQRDTLIARLSALQTQLESVQVSGNSQTRIGDIVQPATLPTAPSSPNHIRDGLLGLIVGLALGTGWAFVRERLDDRIRSQQELERRLGVPVLAAVSHVPQWRDQATPLVVTLSAPNSPVSEAYRTLRTNLQFLGTKEELRTLVVTSPTAGDGKTATAVNLAVAMAQADKRVVVVSADLRRPRLHRFLDLPNETGLSVILADEVSVGDAAARIAGIRNLRVIPSGPVPPNPAELLQSARMRELLRQLQESADVVLLDTPPVLAVADASILASLAHGTLLVVNAESASRTATVQARRQLENAGARIIGAVLNNFDPARSEYYAYRYAYYQYAEGPESNGRGPFNGGGNARRRRDRAGRPAAGFEASEPDR